MRDAESRTGSGAWAVAVIGLQRWLNQGMQGGDIISRNRSRVRISETGELARAKVPTVRLVYFGG